MKYLCLCLSLLMCFNLFSFDNLVTDEPMRSPVILANGQRQEVSLDKYYYVENLLLSGEGIRQDSMIEVLVNGKIKGTIHFPGSDPEYTVTVREVTRSIEFRHLRGGSARISELKVYRSDEGFETNPDIDYPAKFYLLKYSQKVISLTRAIEENISTNDFQKYILPTKIAAGNLYAVASAHGDVSVKSMEKYKALYLTMNQSNEYINTLLTHGATFDLALKYLSAYEEMRDRLDM